MSDKKVVVPEGMLRAVVKFRDEAGLYESGRPVHINQLYLRHILEAALRWLTENPIVPTPDDVAKILAARPVQSDFPDAGYMAIYVASQWQSRMFTAPEPDSRCLCIVGCSVNGMCPVHGDVKQDISHLVRDGKTLCGLTKWESGNVDIDFGLDKVATCAQCLRAIAIEYRTIAKAKEPEVPEAVKDLLCGDSAMYAELDRRIIEAYRRGQKAGTK